MTSSNAGKSDEILCLKGGSVSYGRFPVLWVEEFCLRAGEVAIIRGDNGTGKTSLLRAIVGLRACYGGEIRYCNEDVRSVPSHKRVMAGIRLIPQGRSVFSRLSVEQHRTLASAFLAGEKDTRHCTRRDSSRQANSLSCGEARAMLFEVLCMGQAKLLLLDEPFAGLDDRNLDSVRSTIEDLLARRVTCLFVDHTGIARELYSHASDWITKVASNENVPYSLVKGI